MKTMKKIASLLLALAMIFALATTAFATGDTGDVTTPTKKDSITVTSAKSGETYKLYKLFDLKVNDETNPTAYSYTINKDWDAFFTGSGAGAGYITVNDKGYVTEIKGGEAGAADLAKAAANYAFKPGATKTVIVSENETTAVFSDLADGYWLITSTLGTFAMTRTTPDEQAVTVAEKNEVPTQNKEVEEEANSGEWQEKSDAEIGETVNYKVTINAKKGTTNYVLHDKMDAGLTFDATKVKVFRDNTEVTDGWTLVQNTDDGCTFHIQLDFLNGADSASEVVVTYSATINENAVIKGQGNKNETVLKYGQNSETTHSTVKTLVWEMPVFKYTGADTNKTPLAGAKFSLFTDEGCSADKIVKMTKNGDDYKVATEGTVTEIETGTSGKFKIVGLDSGTYYLKETQAPDGFNKLTKAIKVEIADDGTIKQDGNATTEVGVLNNAGTELPSTGGMGTTLFYVLGGILVAVAVVLLVTKKRMASNN